jgi:hypothetical protein
LVAQVFGLWPNNSPDKQHKLAPSLKIKQKQKIGPRTLVAQVFGPWPNNSPDKQHKLAPSLKIKQNKKIGPMYP